MYIATASTTVKFHEFPSGSVAYNYQPGSKVEGNIRSISWSKDGNWLALVPFSGLTEIISIRDQLKLMHTIQDIEEPSCAVFQNTTKRLVALGTKNGQVLVYDIKARNVKKRFDRTASIITHIDYTANDTHIVAGCKNGEILLYSNTSNTLSSTFKITRSESVSALRTNPVKRNLIIGGSNEGVVAVWDINTSKTKFVHKESHNAPVTSVAFSPVNADLVVSTGMDRQFCFYDIVVGKCIANVSVENSLTAIDFSHDGTYFVVASQNGKVHIYDSRRIQEPVHQFEAHKSSIKHLCFQNMGDVNDKTNSSGFSMNTESIRPVKSTEDLRDNGTKSESFGLFLQIPGNECGDSIKITANNSNEAEDSFMDALGLDNNTADSARHEDTNNMCTTDGIRKWIDTKTNLSNHDSPAPNTAKIFQDRARLSDSKKSTHLSSTPKFLVQNLTTPMSPILSFNKGPQNVTAIDQNAAKDAIKEELREVAKELKEDMKYHSMDIIGQMRRMCLSMQMSMIKEFIKMENHYNSIKDDLSSSEPALSDGGLLEENARLRQRVAHLEEQIDNLTNTTNGNMDTQ